MQQSIVGPVWWRFRYELRQDDHNTLVWKIEPVRGLRHRSRRYNPLTAGDPNLAGADQALPSKLPRSRDEWKEAPHTHLARLRIGTAAAPGDASEVLEFVNRWGLLGLWRVDNYRLMVPSLALENRGIFKPLDGPPCSAWYRVVPPLPKHHPLARWCEPLDVFVLAVQQYQRFCAILAGETERSEGAEDRSSLRRFEAVYELFPQGVELRPGLGPGDRWELAWRCPSLLHACYLRMYLERWGGGRVVRCGFEGCGRLFTTRDSRQTYCSVRCQDAQRKRVKRAAQRAKMEKGG